MRVKDFTFDLPGELIAQAPCAERSGSRLLQLDKNTGAVQDRAFTDILEIIDAGDLLVFNNTRVIPARLFGEKITGGKVEILIERVTAGSRALAQIKASKSPKPDSLLNLERGLQLRVVDRVGDLFLIEAVGDISIAMILDQVGHMPLPPYMEREDNEGDRERYQTVYAAKDGAVAAPTAGLHFDDQLLSKLKNKGVDFGFVTLHVGAGTFQPVRVDDVADHKMHAEFIEVSAEVCNQIREAKKRGNRVIAVGTTSVRSIESASLGVNWVEPYYGDTQIFIYPGYRFRNVDAMITNFHLPESTLIMLVSAFANRESVLSAYNHAVEKEYRFFSYGDAMFIG